MTYEDMPTKVPVSVVEAMSYAGRICPCCIRARKAFRKPRNHKLRTLRTHRTGS